MGLENVSRTRKQDIIFVILKKHAKNGEDIYGDGVLEILQDGFGFLRLLIHLISPDRTIFTSRPVRSAVLICAPGILSQERSDRQKTVTVFCPVENQ